MGHDNSADGIFDRAPATPRRTLLKGAGGLALGSLGLGGADRLTPSAAAAPAFQEATPGAAITRPNILFILMDNFGYGELGCYGGGLTRGAATPRIDSLAHDGTKLLNFNTETQCTPSRSAILTGRYSLRSGTHSVPTVPGSPYGLVDWEQTLADLLAAEGYTTGLFGKWHLGNATGRLPTDRGFDEWYGIPDTTDESLWASQPGFDDAVAHLPKVMEGRKGEPSQEVTDYDLEMRAEIDMEITARTIDFITRAAEDDTPFYAYVPYTLVHYPTIPSTEFQGRTGYGDWADCLAQIDSNVGRLLDTIEDLGLGDDTIVIFTADNGADVSTPPWIGTGGPWTSGLFTPMEGGVRVPFLIRWPGMVPAGRESNELAHEVDTFTTLARWAGAAVPDDRPIDGLDLREFLQGTTEISGREGLPIFFGEQLFAVKWRNFKVFFVWATDPNGPVETLAIPKIFDLMTNQKEDPDLSLTTTHLWVIAGASQVVSEFQASLEEHPPIPMGAPNDYVPATS